MPSEVSGILALIWTYHPVEGSVKLEVTTPETQLNPLEEPTSDEVVWRAVRVRPLSTLA